MVKFSPCLLEQFLHVPMFDWFTSSILLGITGKTSFLAGFNCGFAQEIVTACKNRVRTVPLICDGYQPLKLDTKEEDDGWKAKAISHAQ